MRVYKLRYQADEGNTNRVQWFASVRQAKAEVVRLRREEDGFDIATASLQPHDIPTKLDGLLVWLNQHVDTDNG